MSRFIALVKREWIIGRRDLVIYAAVIILVLLGNETLQSIIARYAGTPFPQEVYGTLFPPFLFVGGIIITVALFADDLFKKENQHTFLMLPATNGEKFLSKSLLAMVAYPVVLTVFFVLSSLVIEPSLYLIFKNPAAIFNPFAMPAFFTLITRYWVINSIFVLGSTLFRKMALVKTALAFTIVVLLSVAIGFLFLRLFVTIRMGRGIGLFEALARVERERLDAMMGAIQTWKVAGQLLNYLIIPIVLQITAYFRLTEVEATDAV